MPTDINTIWSDVLDIVRDELNEPSFKTWFEHTEAVRLTDDGVFVVGVQNDFARAWLEDRYTQRLSAALTQVVGARPDRSDRRRRSRWPKRLAREEMASGTAGGAGEAGPPADLLGGARRVRPEVHVRLIRRGGFERLRPHGGACPSPSSPASSTTLCSSGEVRAWARLTSCTRSATTSLRTSLTRRSST